MAVHFGNPLALLLLGLLVPVVLWARRSLAGLGKLRGGIALGLRVLIVLLVVLALGRARWSFTKDDLSVIYVLDRSLSIPADRQAWALDYILETEKSRPSGDTVGLVLFGKEAALERPAESRPLFDVSEAEATDPSRPADEVVSLQSVFSPERTGIAPALRLALGAFPPSGRKRVVLISDGNENVGSAAEEAEACRRNGVRVDVLPVVYAYPTEVMVEKVVAPTSVEKGESFDVRVVVSSSHAHSARLHLLESGDLIASEPVELREGRTVFSVPRQVPAPGHYSYSATIESAEDTLHSNNQAEAFTVVRGQGRVLYVEGDVDRAGPLYQALTSQGLGVDLVGYEGLPGSIGEIIPYDALVLSNVAASTLGEDGMRAIELAVKNWGVGLVMVGGEDSFGPGGYQDSPVERALPVTMDIKQRRIMPSGALVVILHTCEIAEGNYWAQQIALAALRVLSPSDEYGIIYYDWRAGESWLFELQRCANKDRMAGLITGVQPGDMPSFITSFGKAHRALKGSTASIKHVVVISDGDPAYPSDEALEDMVADGITVSTVAISPHAQQFTNRLKHVANIGQGRFYEPQNPDELPQIFIKEAATVRRSLIFEEPFTPRVSLASEMTTGIAAGEYPVLRGYVATTGKPLAEVPLVSQHEDPLLAHWQYGLGRSVAFTSDAKGRWAADWLGWGKFSQFWSQVVRWSCRRIGAAGLRARTEVKEDRAHVVVDAIDEDGRFINGIRFSGVLVTPENEELPLRLEQTGPGRYEAAFDVRQAGTHYVSLHYTDEQGRATLFTEGLVVPYSAEFRELQANEQMLTALAAATEGRVLEPSDDVFARTFAAAPSFRDAWPLLLLLAVLLVPADVFVRRVFLDYAALWAKVLAAWRWLLALVVAGRRRVVSAPTHVTTLLSRKKLTREEMGRRASKFEPTGEVELKEPTLTGAAQAPRPVVRRVRRPEVEVERPAVLREEETYLGRLLRAKRKAREGSTQTEDDKEKSD